MASTRGANPRMKQQASSYLRGAAGQPVTWYPWGAEAFEKARREDKPVLLDVGAVWCHWCHVMDGESYEDPETARLINERFVPVKVDRDERPDVDARYQRLVSAMTGQGGWPLTAFLTPQGDVFYGGTYFPPRDAHGRPAFRAVLASVAEAYAREKDRVLEQARDLASAVRRHSGHGPRAVSVVDAAWLERAVAASKQQHDPAHGGWGAAPKFPHPSAIDFLLEEAAHDAEARDIVTSTLDAMRRGGIHDHLRGGFHRYSTDARWHVPHFEKMLYDNAELLRNYVGAYRVLGGARWAGTAHDVARFLHETLSDGEQGGYYGSQDADVTFGDDGDYFTWTLEEVRQATDAQEGLVRLLALHYGLAERGPMHHDHAKNVLHVAAEVDDIAVGLRRDPDEVRRDLEGGRDVLRAARAKRKAPFVDRRLYTNWNGMAIRAVLDYAAVLRRPAARDAALRTLDRFLREAYTPDAGFAHAIGDGAPRGLLDDQAQMLPALLAAYNHAQDPRYAAHAQELAAVLVQDFWAPDDRAFRDVAPRIHGEATLGTLSAPEVPLQDAPSPSANARAVEGLLWLSELTGDASYRDRAGDLLAAHGEAALHNGLFSAAFFQAARLWLSHPTKVVVAGPEADAGIAALHEAALAYGASSMVVHIVRDASAEAGLLPEAVAFARGPARSRAGALVCMGQRCLEPVYDPEALARQLAAATPGPARAAQTH